MEQQELTGHIIGAAIQVHKALGPGFLDGLLLNFAQLKLEVKRVSVARFQLEAG